MENPDETVNGLLMKQRMEWVKLCNQLECENKLLKSKLSEKSNSKKVDRSTVEENNSLKVQLSELKNKSDLDEKKIVELHKKMASIQSNRKIDDELKEAKIKTESNLLQLQIEENKKLKKENFNLKDELDYLNKTVISLKKVNGLNTLTLKQLGYEAVKLGEDWKIKRRASSNNDDTDNNCRKKAKQ